MVTPRHPNDTVTIAPGVLLTIMRLAALDVAGVARMGSVPSSTDRFLRRVESSNGVQLSIEDGVVTAHLYVVAEATADLREMSVHIQKSVARSIRELLGMKVETVNVHVEDVVFSTLPAAEQT